MFKNLFFVLAISISSSAVAHLDNDFALVNADSKCGQSELKTALSKPPAGTLNYTSGEIFLIPEQKTILKQVTSNLLKGQNLLLIGHFEKGYASSDVREHMSRLLELSHEARADKADLEIVLHEAEDSENVSINTIHLYAIEPTTCPKGK